MQVDGAGAAGGEVWTAAGANNGDAAESTVDVILNN